MTYATTAEYDLAVHRYRMEQIAAAGVEAENRKAAAMEEQNTVLAALAGAFATLELRVRALEGNES